MIIMAIIMALEGFLIGWMLEYIMCDMNKDDYPWEKPDDLTNVLNRIIPKDDDYYYDDDDEFEEEERGET